MEIEDLKKICDYQETTQNGPVSINYIDFVYEQDEMAAKRAVRETAIDALLDDEKIPEYHRVREKVDAGNFFENTDMDPMDIATLPNNTSSIKVKSKIIHPSNFISDKHIEDIIINEWIKISKNSIVNKELSNTNDDKFDSSKLPPSGIFDVTFTTRRLIAKLMLASNRIAHKCRIGKATSILYNPDIFNKIEIDIDYFKSVITSVPLDIIPCDLVPSNSIIILRNDSLKSNNINFLVQVNKSDGLYYFNSFQSMNRKCAIIEII